MKQLVIMPGGFHPFHAGHAALYQSAVEAFPGADVYVAATNDTSTRPFPFPVKEKLAQLAGVAPNRFVQVKSPFRAEEIVHKFDPNNTQLIFVRSEKDAGSQPRPGGVKKDGTPSYLQPYDDASDQPLSQRAYMAYLPTVEFGPGMTSATEIRGAWPRLNEKRKTALVMSLYPKTQTNPKLAATVVKLLDTAMGTELNEFAPSSGNGGDEKSYLLQLADDLGNALYGPNKNKQEIENIMGKIRAAGGDVKISWNNDSTMNVVMYHPVHFKQGYLIRLVGRGDQGVAEGLNEFAPGSGGGESGRWYTDDQMTDIVGDGWWNDLDVSGNIPKQQMIQQAQAWLDDQGYSVQVLNCRLNDDDMEWYIEGSFHNPRFAKKGVAEKLGDNRPKLGSKRDAGKSVRKWRNERGLDEVDAQNFVGGMTAGYQRRENQPVDETIGPHQNELLLMLRTDKPAAIVDSGEIHKWREYIQENGWTMLSFGRPPIYSGERVYQPYIISKDPATAMQIRDLMDGAFSGKIKFNSAYHAKLGKLLGYSAWDIAHFILKGAVTGTGRLLFDFFKQLFSKDAKQSTGKEASKPLGIKENTAPNPRVDLTPNYPNYSTLIGEFIGVKKNRAVFRVISAELKPGQGETEKIFRAMSTNTPIGIEISRVKNRAVLEALKPDAFAALQQAKQNIEQNRQQEVDQWEQDFRANSSKLAGQQLRQRLAAPPPAPIPVARPGEGFYALKDRLAQLDIAKQKFEEFNRLVASIKKKYPLVADTLDQLENSLLQDVKDGAADNYASLLTKLSKYEATLTTRFPGIVKEDPDYIDEYNNR